MADDSSEQGPEDVPQIATIMLRRFAVHPTRWRPGEPLDPEVQPWEKLYAEIERVRAEPTNDGLHGLANSIRGLGVLERDRYGRFVHPEAVSFQKSACLAIAESLLAASRTDEDVELAEALVAVCPTAEWEMAYFDTLGELFDDEGDLDLAGELLEKAYQGALDAGVPREIRRSLRQIRRLVDRSGDEDAIPELTGPLPDLLTSVHVAAALGISLRTARGKMTDGSIPSTKFGRQRYTRKEEFLALFKPDRR